MEFTTTEKGCRKLLRGGFIYVKQKDLAQGITSRECVDAEGKLQGEDQANWPRCLSRTIKRTYTCTIRNKMRAEQTPCKHQEEGYYYTRHHATNPGLRAAKYN